TFDNRQTLTSERDNGLVVLGKLTLNTGTLLNEQGYIASRDTQQMTADSLNNRAGIIQNNSTQVLQISGALNNRNGQMIAEQD
ncbi:hypothetical protein ACKI16_47760, partial [Streptomyces scabiei]|uniref:hypothetical protein n=1 Tax=Streptomyces scabiei TaxID=1930 RepID=UPI0038F704D3